MRDCECFGHGSMLHLDAEAAWLVSSSNEKARKEGNLADLRDVEDRRNWQSRQDAVERMKGPEDVIGYTEDGVSRVA